MKFFGFNIFNKSIVSTDASKTKSKKKSQTPREQLIQQMLGWEEAKLDADVEQRKQLFLEKGIKERQYAADGVCGVTYGASMSLENKAIKQACLFLEPAIVKLSLQQASLMFFLDLQFVQACLLKVENRRDYIRMLDELIIHIDVCLLLGLHDQARWMFSEYLNKPHAELSQADYIDPEIDALTRLTHALWTEGKTALISVDFDTYGFYAPLVQRLKENDLEEGWLNGFIDQRLKKSAKTYSQSKTGSGLSFFVSNITPALFPIEILALLYAYDSEFLRSINIEDHLSKYFVCSGNEVFDVKNDAFFEEVSNFIATLKTS